MSVSKIFCQNFSRTSFMKLFNTFVKQVVGGLKNRYMAFSGAIGQ